MLDDETQDEEETLASLDDEEILGLIEALQNRAEELEEALNEIKEKKQSRADELFEALKPKLEEYLVQVTTIIEEEAKDFQALLDENEESNKEELEEQSERVDDILKRIEGLGRFQTALASLEKGVTTNKSEVMAYIDSSSKKTSEVAHRALNLINKIVSDIPSLKGELVTINERLEGISEYDDKEVWKELKALRKLYIARQVGGGAPFRNIAVGGNPSVLGRYNDLNIKAGANVTLSYSNNNTTKYLDLTIAATGGGGGSVIGTTRSINTISTSQTAGNTSLTDYVYICSAGINLTLPDAVGNSNLYTIKNTSTSSILVTTTASETIDTSSTLVLPVQYTAVDLISDSANWQIT